jgi:hypothetical protein
MKTVFNTNQVKSILLSMAFAIATTSCSKDEVEAPIKQDVETKSVLPENNKTFTEVEKSKAIQFRWTPLVPKPKEPVTYRLRIWQLMQGQNPSTAKRENKPIIEKEVTEETETQIEGLAELAPCKAPFLCQFVWSVQAENVISDRETMVKEIVVENQFSF